MKGFNVNIRNCITKPHLKQRYVRGFSCWLRQHECALVNWTTTSGSDPPIDVWHFGLNVFVVSWKYSEPEQLAGRYTNQNDVLALQERERG
jgi:hypothetical protein